MPTLKIDGKTVTVEPGQTVMNAAEKLGIDIPRFCYHPALPVAGNCRMCLVEIEKFPKLATSCTTPVMEGMVVSTRSAKVKEGQRTVLEFLLINHPLDCPICDKAGECMLQDQYFEFSSTPSRMTDEKVHKPKRIDLGPTIKLDQERCVLCTRCVRFMEVFANDHSLGTVNRGDRAILTVFPGKPLDNVYSMNTVDICPVGALTAKDFRFKKRVWFLESTESVCTFCATQCSTVVQHHESVVHRVLPRENAKVNGPWMCDTGRLEYHFVNSEDRVKGCLVRQPDGQQVRATWRDAMAVFAAAAQSCGTRAALLASPRMTNESIWQLGRFGADALGTKSLACMPGDAGMVAGTSADDFLIRTDKNPNSRGVAEILPAFGSVKDVKAILETAEAGKLPLLLVFDGQLLDRAADADRWRKALAKVGCLVVAATMPNELTRMAHVVLPLATWVEEEGTFTRFDGLVQRFRRGFAPRFESKDALGILGQLAQALGKPAPSPFAEAAFKVMAGKIRFYEKLSYAAIGKLGAPGEERFAAKTEPAKPAPPPVVDGKQKEQAAAR